MVMVEQLQSTIFFLLALVVSITVHEFFHAWLAYELGDSTARNLGRLSLNPIVHFDPLGAMMIVFMAFSGWGIGWGKPVPVNPYNLRVNPRLGMGLTSVAGPFSNLALATLSAIPLRLGWTLPEVLQTFLVVMVYTNVGLAVFNLIPLPPLDGFGVLQGLLATFRTRWAYDLSDRLDRLAPYGPVVLLVLLSFGWIFGLNILGAIIGPPMQALLGLLGF
jgi:Zn-dependent protease